MMRMQRAAVPVGALWCLLGMSLAGAQDQSTREKVETLHEEIQTLEKKLQTLKEQLEELKGDGANQSQNQGQLPAEGRLKLEIGGQYRVMANGSNFGWHPTAVSDKLDSQGFANQRFRTWLSVVPTANVEGYLQVEIGHVGWGENFEWTKTTSGPRFPASTAPGGDRIGIELRRAYLMYQREDVGKIRVGVQDWQDAFGQILASSDWDFNVGGISYARTFSSVGKMAFRAGWFRLWEGAATKTDDADLFTFDADFPVKERHGIGFSAYYLNDRGRYSYPLVADYDSSWDLWLGVRGHTTIGALPLNGFLIFNNGERDIAASTPDFDHQGWAAKVELGGYPIGQGQVSVQVLFSTGDDDPSDRESNEFRTIAQSERDNFGAQGYWSYLALSAPHGPSDVNDLGVGVQNRGLGLFTLQGKYEHPIAEKLTDTVAAGWLRSAESNPTSGSRNMGMEIANTFTLDLGGGLQVNFGGAYLFTGDFYRTTPSEPGGAANLWELFSRMQLEF